MADALTIDVSQLVKGAEQLKKMPLEILKRVDDVLTAGAYDIARDAKRVAPHDLGGLRGSISAKTDLALSKHITVNVFYAAYQEFGIGVYAAAYIGILPPEWQEFAAQYKGKKRVKGFHAQPYLYPAFEQNRPKILKAVQTVLNEPITK